MHNVYCTITEKKMNVKNVQYMCINFRRKKICTFTTLYARNEETFAENAHKKCTRTVSFLQCSVVNLHYVVLQEVCALLATKKKYTILITT